MEKSINDNIKNFIKQTPLFDKNYICSVEIPYERMKVGKKSYLSLQCHLRQTEGIDANELVDRMVNLTPKLFKEVKKSITYSGFTINKNEKKDIYKENIYYQNFLLTSKENRAKFQKKIETNSKHSVNYL